MKKKGLYLICNCINGFLECKTEKRNSQCEQGQPREQTRGLFCKCDSGVARCQSQHPESLLANVRSVLLGQVSLTDINQIYVIHEAMNDCKKSKYSLKARFENVNI